MNIFNQHLGVLRPSIFAQMSTLANEYQAINLAQGFPDYSPPEIILKAIRNTANNSDWIHQQYAPSMGRLTLRDKICECYFDYQKVKINSSQVLITHGATEALYLTARALLNPGDEVVVFTPCYDSYLANFKFCQAVVKEIPLMPENFEFDRDLAKKMIGPKTKMILINSPHNPTGKVFTAEEIKFICSLVKGKNTYIVSDEVYEYMTYNDQKHFSLLNIDEIRNQQVVISSLGKTFGMTGLKVGWCISSAEIISALHQVHQYALFCVTHPLQKMLEETLPLSQKFLDEFHTEYQSKMDFFVGSLKDMGVTTSNVQGTYFVLAKIPEKSILFSEGLPNKEAGGLKLAQELCKKGVATIPLDYFFPENSPHSSHFNSWIRLCFAKKENTLKEAVKKLSQLL